MERENNTWKMNFPIILTNLKNNIRSSKSKWQKKNDPQNAEVLNIHPKLTTRKLNTSAHFQIQFIIQTGKKIKK